MREYFGHRDDRKTWPLWLRVSLAGTSCVSFWVGLATINPAIGRPAGLLAAACFALVRYSEPR